MQSLFNDDKLLEAKVAPATMANAKISGASVKKKGSI